MTGPSPDSELGTKGDAIGAMKTRGSPKSEGCGPGVFAFMKTFAGGPRRHPPSRAAGADPGRAQTARHCHLVGSGGAGSGAGGGGPGVSLESAEPEPGAGRDGGGEGEGARSGGGAHRRRSRGLATGSSQWERESRARCAPPSPRGAGWEWRLPHPAERAGKGGRGAFQPGAPSAAGASEALKIGLPLPHSKAVTPGRRVEAEEEQAGVPSPCPPPVSPPPPPAPATCCGASDLGLGLPLGSNKGIKTKGVMRLLAVAERAGSEDLSSSQIQDLAPRGHSSGKSGIESKEKISVVVGFNYCTRKRHIHKYI